MIKKINNILFVTNTAVLTFPSLFALFSLPYIRVTLRKLFSEDHEQISAASRLAYNYVDNIPVLGVILLFYILFLMTIFASKFARKLWIRLGLNAGYTVLSSAICVTLYLAYWRLFCFLD